jgi:hypothetical protein
MRRLAPYLPDLTTAPTDFAVGLTVTVPGENFEIAIGGDGSAWVISGDSIVRFSASGTQLNTIPLSFYPNGLVIDAQGRAG